jgi:DNA-binding MarR family transcriptional regulator
MQMLRREQSAGYMTNWAARLLIRTIAPKLEKHGMTVGYLPVFFTLSESPGITQKQIAEIIGVEQPTMAATLSRMERDGLIDRTPDPADGRSALISLSAEAMKKLPDVEAAIAETNAQAFSQLTASERRQFFQIMGKIVTALGGA